MSQSGGLCFLQVSESRHDGFRVLPHDGKERPEQGVQFSSDRICLTPDVHAHIESHLIISASAGVQLFPGVSDAVDEICLHKAVHIFIFIRDGKMTALHVVENPVQSFCNLCCLLRCQDSLSAQHCRVGQ